MVEAPLSLRGNGPWTGFGDESAMLPGPQTFRLLENCYISKDGTEIRRIPGTRLSGLPFFGQPYDIQAITKANPTVVQLDCTDVRDEAWLPASGGAIQIVAIIEGNEIIADGVYEITRTGTDTFTIPLNTSASGATGTSGTVFLQRTFFPMAMAHVDRRAVVIAQTTVWKDSGATLVNNVAAAVSTGPLSFSSPPRVTRAVSGTPADGFEYWPSTTVTGFNEHIGTSGSAISGAQRIFPRRRSVLDTYNGRVIVAVPGHGCLFETNLRAGPPTLPIRPPEISVVTPDHRWLKMLGISHPAGDLNNATAVSAGGSLTQDKWYGIQIAYLDVFTGEVGFRSDMDTVFVDSASSHDAIDYTFYRPRAGAFEQVGLAVVIFLTDPQETEDAAREAPAKAVRISGPFSSDADFGTQQNLAGTLTRSRLTERLSDLPADVFEVAPRRVPRIEVAPVGGYWVAVARGRVFAGSPQQTFKIQGWPTVEGDAVYIRPNTELNLVATDFDDDLPLVAGRIPLGYNGQRLLIAQATTSGLGRGRIVTGTQGRGGLTTSLAVAIEVDFLDTNETTPLTLAKRKDYLLILDRNLIRYTEEGAPTVAPGDNTLIVDQLAAENVTAGHRYGEALMVWTASETYMFSWSVNPRNSSAATISNHYGCIAPGAICEGPFGLAWLSKDGPMLFNGGLDWIGRAIREWWADCLTDSEGMMHHAQVSLDRERELVVWTLRRGDDTDWAAMTNDSGLSKASCDTVLMWSWTTGQFTTADTAGPRRSAASRQMIYDDGFEKPTFSLSYQNWVDGDEEAVAQPLYGFDETAADRLDAPPTLTVTTGRFGTTSDLIGSGTDYARFAEGDEVMVVNRKTGTLGFAGRVGTTTWNVGATTATMQVSDGTGLWNVGDIVYGRILPMRMQTHYQRLSAPDAEGLLERIVIRCTHEAAYAFALVTAENERGETWQWTKGDFGDRLLNGTTIFQSGAGRGSEFRVNVTIWATAQVRVKDIVLGVSTG